MIQIKIDLTRLSRALRDVGMEARQGQIVRDGLNRALDGAYTVTRRGIAEHVNMPMRQVEGTMKKYPASGGSMVARLVTRSKAFSAADNMFNPRDTGKGGWRNRTGSGTFFRPWKDNNVVNARRGFSAAMKARWTEHHEKEFQAGRMKDRGGRSRAGKVSHKGFFQRKGKNRLPLERVDFGPSTGKEMRRYGIPQKISVIAMERVAKRFTYQLGRAIDAAKARYGL